MVKQLESLLGRVTDWIKYEEAKNGALIALDGVGLTLLWPNAEKGMSIFLGIGLFALMLSVLVALSSFFPVEKGKLLHKYMSWRHSRRLKDAHARALSVLFFVDIAGRERETYLQDFRAAAYGSSNPKNLPCSSLALDYASEIIANSEIAAWKAWLFRVAFFFTVLGLLGACGAALDHLKTLTLLGNYPVRE